MAASADDLEKTVKRYDMLIDGKWVQAEGGRTFLTEDPFLREEWGEIPRATPSDANDAVNAAHRALSGEWSGYTPTQRGHILRRFADLISKEAERIALLEVQDNGKLLAEMRHQLSYIPEWFHYYGGLADKIEGAVIPIDKPSVFNFTWREPLGVVLAILAWNSPLMFFAYKAAPALAAGNTVVVKPSEFTSVSMLEIARLAEKAGFPKGVINVVTGFGQDIGDSLVEHPLVRKVAFTGSDGTGQRIAQKAATNLIPVTLELGGKSANIVFEDAELDNAVNGAMAGIFGAGGQTCAAGSRLLIQKNLADEFTERLLTASREIRLGDPREEATQMGPMANRPQFEKVKSYYEIAAQDGAEPLLGGKASELGGYFVEPTIYGGVTNSMRIAREEVFGPLLSILTFDDEDEAIDIANDSPYGLAAGIWSTDYRRMLRVSKAIAAGTIWINTFRAVSVTSPFGGYKRSGYGREMGIETLEAYLQTKSVWMDTAEKVRNPFVIG